MIDQNDNDHSNDDEDEDEAGFRLDQDISLPKSKFLFYTPLSL